jgi:membrane-associated phospholipid phosphatase
VKTAFAVLLTLALATPALADPAADSTATAHRKSHTLLWGAATVVAIGGAACLDRTIEEETDESHTAFEEGLSDFAEPFGNAAFVGAALAVTWGAAHLTDKPSLVRSTVRIGASDVTASLEAFVLKNAIGRKRPKDSPGDPFQFEPFSGNESFPSGHTTIAFCTAVAIDRESKARWVPFVVYPMAGLVGWSRIHDDEHWTSDVVAGAALGSWTATAVENHFEKHGMGWFQRFCWTVTPEPHGWSLGLATALN